MKIKISLEVFDEYLKISLSGGNPYKEIDEILKAIKTLMDENNRKRVLIEAIDIIIPSEMEKRELVFWEVKLRWHWLPNRNTSTSFLRTLW